MGKLRGKAALAAGVSVVGLLMAAPAFGQDALGDDSGTSSDIIVTATKTNEALRDVPASISAVTEADFDRLNAQSLSDYITRVPGVVFNDYQPGVSEVVIRGIASTTYHEANQSTTGYYLNQIPLIEPGFPLAIPDIDTFDLKQVEVLRGPQGTLFGSSSLGGAINYVPNEADASALDAGFEGFLSSTRRAGEANYAAKAMINVPIVEDKLALRVVALQRSDAGYLDNTLAGVDGSNDLRVRGLRGSLVWTPAEGTRIAATSMFQEYDLDDQTYVLFPVGANGAFQPSGFNRETNVLEYQHTEVMLHSLRLDQELGDAATLTALGSYVRKENDLRLDDSIFLGYDVRTGTPQLSGSTGKSETYYGELRLASAGDGPFTWLIGANFTKLKSNGTDLAQIEGIGAYIDANPALFGNQPSGTIAPDDLVQRTVNANDVREIAAFGELSYTFADVLTLTAGGRVFQYTSQPRLQFLPNANLIPTFDYQPGKQKESDFIPKLSIRYKPSEAFMAYALYSEGFRIGGINVYSQAAGTPLSFGSDSTKNYEVGARFDVVPGMSFDVSAYHIKWDDIQARLFTPVTFNGYTVNGGGAKVDGVEALINFRPAPFLTYTTSVSYNKARLSELLVDSSAAGGGYAKGTTLPGASRWTIANQLQLDLRDSPLHPRIGIAHRFLSKAPVAFGSALQKGGFSIVDLNASFDVTEGVEVGAFVQNLFDTYGVLNAPFSFAGSVTRPRTIGATLRFNLR
jgi:outer membrane receptor protein involved in Fe transport